MTPLRRLIPEMWEISIVADLRNGASAQVSWFKDGSERLKSDGFELS
jgi:hypothetical protein